MKHLQIISNRKWYYVFSLTILVLGLASWAIWGLKLGLDFTGGSLLEIKYENIARPEISNITKILADNKIEGALVQPVSSEGFVLRMKELNNTDKDNLLFALQAEVSGTAGAKVVENRFELIGPSVSSSLRSRAIWAMVLASLFIILYITFAFRKVSAPVSSWKYGVMAILALLHDLAVVVGLFAILGHFAQVEVDSLFVTALLTILGFSVHDTIVVFDRIRENLLIHRRASFAEVVNNSVNQTLARSINTSVTVFLVLLALLLFGASSIQWFIVALLVGIFIGTYSSIFVASCLLVTVDEWKKK